MNNLLIILSKIAELAILILAGIIAKKYKLISDEGESDLSKLLVDFFWPASIYYSIVAGLTPQDITGNLLLPVSALVTGFTGLLLAKIFVGIFGYAGDEKKIFLYHGAVNNFVFMVIPFATLFLGPRGTGLLFLHNLGFIVFLWTVGVSVLTGKNDESSALKRLMTPGLMATVLGIITVLSGLQNHIPRYALSIIDILGKPTLVIAMIIAGSRIYSLGFKSLNFNIWNLNIGIIRLVLVPGILFLLTMLLRPYVKDELLIIFMLVNVMPVSLNSISLARRYNTSTKLAAEGVVFTHVFGVLTMTLYILGIQIYFGL